MRHGSLFCVLIGLAGCPGGGGGVGDICGDNGDCQSSLQCLASECVPRCQRAPECGDGYSCDQDGLCHLATGTPGSACLSEVDCGPGLACEIDGADLDEEGRFRASCTANNIGKRPAGALCDVDDDCRNNTCALGRCVDLCTDTRDCGAGSSCTLIPRIDPHHPEAAKHRFFGCLQSSGTLTWTSQLQPNGPSDTILVPVPDSARSLTMLFSVNDPAQKVGAKTIYSPKNVTDPNTGAQQPQLIYTAPCIACSTDARLNDYYNPNNLVRHMPDNKQSVLAMPSSPRDFLLNGTYQVEVSSFRADGSTGSAIPQVTAVVKLDAGVILDLHFYFLDLTDHPCWQNFGGAKLDASVAQVTSSFQTDYLGGLRSIFSPNRITLGTVTYEDLTNHHDFDGLDIADAGELLKLGTHAGGINIFFVRTLSPTGLQAYGPNPGPAGLPGTPQSGIIISADTLCYRTWPQLARVTAHELARYMGLYHNVELGTTPTHPTWRDPLDDDDTSEDKTNLMYFSELGGTTLSPSQCEILTRSGVLR